MPSASTEVLVVGAGPTGLILALWLRRLGVNVRIIDKTAGPGTTSRAIAIHARTLELYRQMGMAEEVVERGLKFSAFNLWVGGKKVGHAALGDIGRGVSPFPYMLSFPQDAHEQLLVEHLRKMGVEVDRNTELVGFEDRGDNVVARMKRAGIDESIEASYIAGCDGAHSKVREGLGIGFLGSTYGRMFYVADVSIRGPVSDRELHVDLDHADFLAIFPMKAEGAVRLIGTVRHESASERELGWEDVSRAAVDEMGIIVDRVNWFSTYRVHHRVAEHFHRGRAFLSGDAAHIHSPVGGQGMNTGIGDAANLSWKLADVLRGRARAELLDTYEPERIAFARRLVATTDRAFTFVTREGPLARWVRLHAAPAIIPRLVSKSSIRQFMFRTVSQTTIQYRQSALSAGRAGSIRGGDRLPWVAPEREGGEDNFTPLASLSWQLHVYGQASEELMDACRARNLPLVTLPFGQGSKDAGLAEHGAYLVRPDGYVALAFSDAKSSTSATELERYLKARGLYFKGA